MKKAAALLVVLWAAPSMLAAQPPSPAPSWPSAGELAAVDARQVLGDPAGAPVSGSVLDARTDEVASLLRCPVCQGLSVADSPSTMAQNMKGQVRDLLAQGYDSQQVMAYFESSYGEFVRLQPPLRGINWLLWLAPAVALAGAGLVFARVTRRRSGAAALPAAAPTPAPEDPALARYRERVRALAYGGEEAAPAAKPGEPREGR